MANEITVTMSVKCKNGELDLSVPINKQSINQEYTETLYTEVVSATTNLATLGYSAASFDYPGVCVLQNLSTVYPVNFCVVHSSTAIPVTTIAPTETHLVRLHQNYNSTSYALDIDGSGTANVLVRVLGL